MMTRQQRTILANIWRVRNESLYSQIIKEIAESKWGNFNHNVDKYVERIINLLNNPVAVFDKKTVLLWLEAMGQETFEQWTRKKEKEQ